MSNQIEISANCHMEGSKLIIHYKTEFMSELSKHFADKNNLEIVIRDKKKIRSSQQNRYYWGIVVPIVRNCFKDSFGETYTPELIHDYLKGRFNSKAITDTKTGEVIQMPQTTTKLSPMQYNEYFTIISEWVDHTFGVQIPQPNEQVQINLI